MNRKKTSGFILISALIALSIMSFLAATNLSRAKNQLKLDVLQKDGWNALNSCYSAQNVAIKSVKNNTTSGDGQIDLTDDSNISNIVKLQKNPSYVISQKSSYTRVITTCYGVEKNVKITTELSLDSSTKSVINWKICENEACE